MNIKHIKVKDIQYSMARALPVFRGYTVDVRLQQFRKASPDSGMEYVNFASPEGDDLLEEYIGTLDKNSAEFQELAAYLLTRG
jgi:hypothetical protein